MSMRLLMNIRRIQRMVPKYGSAARYLLSTVRGLPSQWCVKDSYGNPVDEFKDMLQVPILNANETVYNPTKEQIKKANDSFQRVQIETMIGVVDASQLPVDKVPEVCFIGQSNVGKSSLIKALLNNPEKVKILISKTPGRTKTLNFYRLGKLFTLVDVPGYGENMPEYYVECVENYVNTRKTLVRTFLLIDGAAGLSDVDKIGIEMMEEFGKPYVIVMTKIDNASHHMVLRNLLEIKHYRDKNMPSAFPQIFLVSAHQGAGLSLLRALILYLTGNAPLSETD